MREAQNVVGRTASFTAMETQILLINHSIRSEIEIVHTHQAADNDNHQAAGQVAGNAMKPRGR